MSQTAQEPLTLTPPEVSLVVVIGLSATDTTEFAAQHFSADELLHVTHPDDPHAAHQLLLAAQRLRQGQLTVITGAFLTPQSRRPLIKLAKANHVSAIVIVLDWPVSSLSTPATYLNQQLQQLRRSLSGLSKEGFEDVWILKSKPKGRLPVVRQPLPSNKQHLHGPFDFIGDVHGCLTELQILLAQLGYCGAPLAHPAGRTAIFVGDLTDRGPDSAGVLRLVMEMSAQGSALVVSGNHDDKLRRALQGRSISQTHGLQETLAQLEQQGQAFKQQVLTFLEGLHSYLRLDGGAVVVAHAGLPERYHHHESERIRHFALYGDVDGSIDSSGLPIRRDWAAQYTGPARVVYGHTPVTQAHWVNNTIDIDTGCVFGGALTALRYPELNLFRVPAQSQYALPSRPFID